MAARKKKAEQQEGSGSGFKLITKNRRAFHNYHVFERVEAGIALQGTEVKSLRQGNVSIQESFARVREGEVFLYDCHIAPYEKSGYVEHEPKRKRKLLLHRREIKKLVGKIEQKGYSLIPLSLYFKRGYAKVELGVCVGKRKYDKREDMKKREAHRDMRREIDKRRRK